MKDTDGELPSVSLPLQLVTISNESVPMSRIKTEGAAIEECYLKAGLSQEAAADYLGMGKAQLSKIVNNTQSMAWPKKKELMEVCGNEIPMAWCAWDTGNELHRIETELEQENRLLRKELDQERRDKKVMMRVFKEAK